ncbi:MAG: hypothetical protein V8S25_04095 [Faecalibacterium prausnitzii]
MTIELDGNNELKSGNLKAGLEKNTSEGTLTLKDDKEAGSGSLTAEGGGWAAGIGGSDGKGTNNIIISGGTVTAEGGNYGAGIGSGGGSYDGGDQYHDHRRHGDCYRRCLGCRHWRRLR